MVLPTVRILRFINLPAVPPAIRGERKTAMTTVQGSKGRRYEVRTTIYGTSNIVNRLYFGGVFLAADGTHGLNVPSVSLEEAIEKANHRADILGLQVTD